MKAFLIGVCVMMLATIATAQTRNFFETEDAARQRIGVERQRQYEENRFGAPLGGYGDRLGEPAPRQTESPGIYLPRERSYDADPRLFGSPDPYRPR